MGGSQLRTDKTRVTRYTNNMDYKSLARTVFLIVFLPILGAYLYLGGYGPIGGPLAPTAMALATGFLTGGTIQLLARYSDNRGAHIAHKYGLVAIGWAGLLALSVPPSPALIELVESVPIAAEDPERFGGTFVFGGAIAIGIVELSIMRSQQR